MTTPYELPPGSPWFDEECGGPCFLSSGDVIFLFSDYANWPASVQAKAAAIAALEWRDSYHKFKAGSSECNSAWDDFSDAEEEFYTARERMKAEDGR